MVVLKRCKQCNVLFKGEGDLCSTCSEKEQFSGPSVISYCTRCRRLSGNLMDGLCTSCAIKAHGELKVIQNFISRHPDTSISEVHQVLGIERSLILQFIRDGEISLELEFSSTNTCKVCGSVIPIGKTLCVFCQKDSEDIQALRDTVSAKASIVREYKFLSK